MIELLLEGALYVVVGALYVVGGGVREGVREGGGGVLEIDWRFLFSRRFSVCMD